VVAIKAAKRSRLIAAGRLFDIDNITKCFKVKRPAVVVSAKYRARSRDIWGDKGVRTPTITATVANQRAARAIAKLQARADRIYDGGDQAKRLKKLATANKWASELRASLLHTRFQSGILNTTPPQLKSIWAKAAFPTKHSLLGGVPNPSDITTLLKKPIFLEDANDGDISSSGVAITRTANISLDESSIDLDPFAEIDDDAYDIATAQHKASGLSHDNAPLNPEQRACGRAMVTVALLRRDLAQQGLSPNDISTAVKQSGLHQIIMMTGMDILQHHHNYIHDVLICYYHTPQYAIGAGGTGKSAVVHALRREFRRLSLGRVLVTAYTGVAAAPFGGPTLLKLLNLNLHTKLNARVAENNALDRQIKCEKFKDECGAPIQEFGCVVIDEISFIDAVVFGHVDQGFAILLDNSELCGGLPLLLCGDNHQKPPPGGTPWYQYMVKIAAKEETDPSIHSFLSAKNRGINLLSKARRVELHRLMRARNDPDFIAVQQRMRQTELLHPVPGDFVNKLRMVTLDDIARDPAWRFAPIGVLTHIERDTINLEQLKAFAKAFNLPIFRWRCFLVDGEALEPGVRNELYNHEPNL
jgi:hypothetical protein